jgi:threonine/homoserine/homoserine lactone efflux protein
MTLHSYFLFVVASLILVLVPGPDMIYMLGRCIAQGRKAGVMAAIGFNLGGYTHLAAATLGLSALLAASATAFTVVKWIGAAYLIYLGVATLRAKAGTLDMKNASLHSRTSRTILFQAYLSDVLNPKVALFFLALLPQFVDPRAAHPTLHILLLGVTLNMIAITLNLILVALSARGTEALRGNARVGDYLQKALGALFIGLGLRLIAEKT